MLLSNHYGIEYLEATKRNTIYSGKRYSWVEDHDPLETVYSYPIYRTEHVPYF